MIRTVVLDPYGQLIEPYTIGPGNLYPVKSYIAVTQQGELVQVLQADVEQFPKLLHNPIALEE